MVSKSRRRLSWMRSRWISSSSLENPDVHLNSLLLKKKEELSFLNLKEMTEERNKKRKAASKLPIREDAMPSPSIKSVLYTKIDVDSDEAPRLKKGTRSVTAHRHGVRRNKLIAHEFHPGIVQTVRLALFQQTKEPQCGANLVRNLCAQKLIPPKSIARELLDVIKFGPKVEGGRTLQTEVASSYACSLVLASSRFLRQDGSAIFGPSSWDDVEVLLSQSTDRAIASSGLIVSYELQMAACGAKLLALLLKTELLDFNLSSTDVGFDSESLRAKPTVAILKKQGSRNVLKTATRHTVKCLVRHAKWLLDSGLDMSPSSQPQYVQSCAAKTCLDSLGSVICYTAWLVCAEERVSINHYSCAMIIRDAVLSELSLCDDTLPKMKSEKKKVFITKLKLHFLLSLHEEFAFPIQDLVGNLIGLEDALNCFDGETTGLEGELDCFDGETTKLEGDAVCEVGNIGCGSTNQLVRKSSVPVLVQRQNELVEAYELENKYSSLFWVEYVSDGKCTAVSSDRIVRGRKRNPRPSKRPTYKVDPLLLSRQGKSSRFLSGETITPLDKNIIQDDLRQMKAYDKACKSFRIQSFLSRNQEPTEGVQPYEKSDPTHTVTDDLTLRAPIPMTPTQISRSNSTQNQSQHQDLEVGSTASPDSNFFRKLGDAVWTYNKKIAVNPPIIDVPPEETRKALSPCYERTPGPNSKGATYYHQHFKRGNMEELHLIKRRGIKRRFITEQTSDVSYPHQSPNVVAANHNHGFTIQGTNPQQTGATTMTGLKGAPDVLHANSVAGGVSPTAAYHVNIQVPSQMSNTIPYDTTSLQPTMQPHILQLQMMMQPQVTGSIGIYTSYGRIPYSPYPRPSPPIMWDQIPLPPAYAPCPPQIPWTPNQYPPEWTLPPRTYYFR